MLEGKWLFLVISLGMAGFIVSIALIATEYLEGSPIYKETNYITLVFREKDGNIEAINGIRGINPTIVMRSSLAHQMMVTVGNYDDEPHQLIIEGVASTPLLEPRQVEELVLSGGSEGEYKYVDGVNNRVLGKFLIVKVSAFG